MAKKKILRLLQRIALATMVIGIQSFYLLTSTSMSGGVVPRLPFESYPIRPVWVVPYVLCYPLWLGGLIGAVWKMEDRLFRAFIAGCVLTFGSAQIIFVAYPTYVERTPLMGSDLLTNVLRALYQTGGAYDALPSGHIYITTLLALFYSHWMGGSRILWMVVVLIVALSTLFTGQHYLLDLVAGFVLAWFGYRFGLRWVREKNEAK